MAIFALISNNYIENIVVCDSYQFTQILWPSYETLDVTTMVPQPGIGWVRTESGWTPPSQIIVSGSQA
jgi:hypothetical protein